MIRDALWGFFRTAAEADVLYAGGNRFISL